MQSLSFVAPKQLRYRLYYFWVLLQFVWIEIRRNRNNINWIIWKQLLGLCSYYRPKLQKRSWVLFLSLVLYIYTLPHPKQVLLEIPMKEWKWWDRQGFLSLILLVCWLWCFCRKKEILIFIRKIKKCIFCTFVEI